MDVDSNFKREHVQSRLPSRSTNVASETQNQKRERAF